MFKTLIALIFVTAFILPSAHALYCEESGNPVDNTGTLISGRDDKCWTMAKNGTGLMITAGYAMVMDNTADDGMTVATATVQGGPGHCVYMENCNNGNTCKCQVWGRHSAIYFDAAVTATAGNYMFMSDTEGYVEAIYTVSTIEGGDQPIGIFLDGATTSGTIDGYLRML